MCGIAGIYRSNGDCKIPLDSLQRMVTAINHRGPDESGIYIDRHVGLGHARLSIIDLSSGSQPIHNENQTVWVVFNGEIYNYPELRQSLQNRGHQFYTSTDTEVLVHLYEEKGVELLDELNGQFAFAIWDDTKKELFLARDRVGIRPLHYIQHKESLIFASEIKSLFSCEGVQREIDPVAMDQIFTFWTTLPGQTAFKGICELPPGHFMLASRGHLTIQKYWSVPLYPKEERFTLPVEQISEQIQELLRDAVRIRLRADVPVGCYLSGGLDSSIVTSLVAREFNNHVQTYGIRFQDEAYDEGQHQREMVSFLKVNHKEIMATDEHIGEAFAEVLWHCEKPLLRTSPIPLFLLSRLVRNDSLKVVLTGEGADEVFGGYNIFKESKIRNFWARQPDSQARPALLKHLYPYIFKDARSKAMLQLFFGRGLENTGDPLFSHLIRWQNTSKIKSFFSNELRAAVGSYDPYQQLRENLPASFDKLDSLTKAQYLEMTIFMSNYLLCSQGDRVAMANSVEIRLPYLDPRIIELMARTPSKWKLLGLDEKHILKKSFGHILPETIAQRRKHPYRAPIKRSLLDNSTADYTHDLLSDKYIKEAGLFDARRVRWLLDKLEKTNELGEIDSMALVGILSAQIVHHKFINSYSPATDTPISPSLIIDRRPNGKCNKNNQLVGIQPKPN